MDGPAGGVGSPCALRSAAHLLVAAVRYSPPEGMHGDCVDALVLAVKLVTGVLEWIWEVERDVVPSNPFGL